MVAYQWTSGILGVLVAGVIFFLIRKDHLHSRYALWWVPIALAIASLGIYPQASDHLARFLGINYPPVLALTMGIAFLVIKLLLMDIERSGNERKLHRLVQRVAMLEGKMHELDKQMALDRTKHER